MQTKFKAALLALALLMSSGVALAEDNFWLWLVTFSRQKEVRAVDNKTYADECGSCHFAYPPGLLPSKSWEKLLNEKALKDHFGENAELDKDTLKTVYDYAMDNAADKSWYKRSRKIAKATEDVSQSAAQTIKSADTYSGPVGVEGLPAQRTIEIEISGLTGTGNKVTLQKSLDAPGAWTDVATYTDDQSISYNDSIKNQVIFYRLGIKAGSYAAGSTKVELSSAGVAPLRITEVRYIKRKHHDIPEKMVKGNKDVKSLSYCDACHTKAKDGIFDEDTVDIPNYPDR